MPDQWDSINYPELSALENGEIRAARRAGFAAMFPAFPSAASQAWNTLAGARVFMLNRNDVAAGYAKATHYSGDQRDQT